MSNLKGLEEIIFDSYSNLSKYLDGYNQLCIVSGSCINELNIAKNVYNDLRKNISCSIFSISIPSGEKSKSESIIKILIDSFIKFRIDRFSAVICIGGGAVSDSVGFVSSIYMRGIDIICIPTTLLSMIDASIGGKRAINYKKCKNLIGTFYLAKKIMVDMDVLKTLPNDEIVNGLCELVKIALVFDCDTCKEIIKHKNDIWDDEIINLNALNWLVKKAINCKQNIVRKDMYDNCGLRQFLNYGHSLAHGLEAVSNGKISHGISVAIGMDFAAYVSYQLGICDKTFIYNQIEEFEALNIYPSFTKYIKKLKKLNIDDIINFMSYDKKNSIGTCNFIVLKKLSKPKSILINLNDLKDYLYKYIFFRDIKWGSNVKK